MVREFVPEMRSDKKDAEIARLREQVRVLRKSLKVCRDTLLKRGMPTQPEMLDAASKARAALAATEEK